jgi:hypothetical protein
MSGVTGAVSEAVAVLEVGLWVARRGIVADDGRTWLVAGLCSLTILRTG